MKVKRKKGLLNYLEKKHPPNMQKVICNFIKYKKQAFYVHKYFKRIYVNSIM